MPAKEQLDVSPPVLGGLRRALAFYTLSEKSHYLPRDEEASPNLIPVVPTRLNAQAHLLYFDAEVDYEDDVVDKKSVQSLPLTSQDIVHQSRARALDNSCLCFGSPCGNFALLLIAIAVFLAVSMACSSNGVHLFASSS